MAFPNSSYTDIIATTIEQRSREIADNVTNNNAILKQLELKGRMRPFSGGSLIIEELSFAANGNAAFYSGYDLLPVAAQDVISAAQFSIKQAACPVVMSGLEDMQNAGREQMIDLMDARLAVAEASMANLIAQGLYSDGTGYGGKQITGLALAVPADPTTGTYGGIDRSTTIGTFWRSQLEHNASYTATTTTIQTEFNTLWAKCLRGKDRPDLIILDTLVWSAYMASLQAQQRFVEAKTGALGFPSIKYMDADVVLDGGIGGYAPSNSGWFLNTNYLSYRPHTKRNMKPLSPGRRVAINQDAEVEILAWGGNLTCSGAQFQGFFKGY